jgi:hypothetical protein
VQFRIAFVLLLAACGPPAAQLAAIEQKQVAADFPLVAMQLVIARGGRGALVLSLADDGTLREGQTVVATVKGNRVVNAKGEIVIAVEGDGRVSHAGRRTPIRFEGEELESDNNRRISVDDGGNVVFAPPMHGKRARTTFRFEGFAPKARRTALLVLLVVVLENDKDEE